MDITEAGDRWPEVRRWQGPRMGMILGAWYREPSLGPGACPCLPGARRPGAGSDLQTSNDQGT